jgi:hypothetical protein
MQYAKTVNWGQKDLTYTSLVSGDTTRVDYEDQDSYNELLHTDEKFARLTIGLAEFMLDNIDNTIDWDKHFDVIKDYLNSIDKFEGNLGSFRIN